MLLQSYRGSAYSNLAELRALLEQKTEDLRQELDDDFALQRDKITRKLDSDLHSLRDELEGKHEALCESLIHEEAQRTRHENAAALEDISLQFQVHDNVCRFFLFFPYEECTFLFDIGTSACPSLFFCLDVSWKQTKDRITREAKRMYDEKSEQAEQINAKLRAEKEVCSGVACSLCFFLFWLAESDIDFIAPIAACDRKNGIRSSAASARADGKLCMAPHVKNLCPLEVSKPCAA